MLNHILMRAAILPLDFSTPEEPGRTELSLILQNNNWDDMLPFLTDPAKWLNDQSSRWPNSDPFVIKTPTTIVLQHLFKSSPASLAASDFVKSHHPNAFDLPANSFEGFQLELFVPALSASLSDGYFQVEYAINDTDVMNVSYFPPASPQTTCAVDTSTFTNVNVICTDMQDPSGKYTLGRVHFDIGVNDDSAAANRACLIKSYIENPQSLCDLINNLGSNTVRVAKANVVEEGSPIVIPGPGAFTSKKFTQLQNATGVSAVVAMPASLSPTVTIEGGSLTSGCYICVDTAIFEDGDNFYPSDALYKLYCPPAP